MTRTKKKTTKRDHLFMKNRLIKVEGSWSNGTYIYKKRSLHSTSVSWTSKTYGFFYSVRAVTLRCLKAVVQMELRLLFGPSDRDSLLARNLRDPFLVSQNFTRNFMIYLNRLMKDLSELSRLRHTKARTFGKNMSKRLPNWATLMSIVYYITYINYTNLVA